MAGPTNSDLMREIKNTNRVTDDHEIRIKATEHYIVTQQAVAEYVARFGTPAQKEGSNMNIGLDGKNLGPIIVKLFALFTGIVALIYAIINTAR